MKLPSDILRALPSLEAANKVRIDIYIYLQDAVTLILTDSQNGVFTGGNVVLAWGTENEDWGNCKGEIGPRLDFGC